MTDQTDDALTDLINKLIDATHEKKIGWAETDEKDTYLYAARNSSILVAGRDTSEGRLRVTLRILNHEGTTVESLSSTWTASLLPGIGGATRGPWNDLLEEIYTAARRSALDVRGVLNDLLESLE